MKLKDLKIGVRLGLSFGVTLMLTFAIAVVSLSGLSTFNDSTNKATESGVPAILDLYQLLEITQAHAVMERDALAAQAAGDAVTVTSSLQAIDDGHDVVVKAFKELEALIDTPESRDLWSKIGAARQAYLTSRAAVLEQIKAGDTVTARQKLLSEQVLLEQQYLGGVKKLIFQVQHQISADGAASGARYVDARRLILALAALALAMGAILAVVVTRSITTPLRHAVDGTRQVAQGDLTSLQADATSKDETGQLLRALKTMAQKLSQTVGEIRVCAEDVMSGAQQIAKGNTDLSSRTEQQAVSLQETAASMDELTSTVKANAENAKQASGLAKRANAVSREGAEVVAKVVETMVDIEESSSRIADIIGIIEGIAFQTNILALNAAVEAARAGAQGRGFAVVASEVRSLAQRSSSAAKEIKELIETSGSRVNAGTELASKAGQTMKNVSVAIQRVTNIMGEIALASHEQTQGIEQVNLAISQMDGVTQQNAALVEEAAAAAGSMEEQAKHLHAAVAVFQTNPTPTGASPRAPR